MLLTAWSPLHTPRLLLRTLQYDDLTDLMALYGDAAVTRYLPFPAWQGPGDAGAWFEEVAKDIRNGTGLLFVIIDKSSTRVIGTCTLYLYDAGSANVDIGYAMCRAFWKRGLTQEAVSALIEHVFSACGIRRLGAYANTANTASHALLLKLGFTCEGKQRQRWVHQGQIYDAHTYGLLRDDPRPHATL
jgi:ribosomal-protein-alanine N-acetyltransferase